MKLAALPLLLLLCACTPAMAAAPAQAPASPAGPLDGALLAAQATQAAYYAQASQAAQTRQDAAAATAVEMEQRKIDAQLEAQHTQGAIEAARLAMARQAALETSIAAATADHLSAISTMSAISATQTAGAFQAAALGQQATGTAVSDNATRAVIDADRLNAPRRAQATAIALIAAPTMAAEAAERHQKRLDSITSLFGTLCVSAGFLLALVVSWQVVRVGNVAVRAAEYRAALPPSVTVQRAAVQAPEPAPRIEPKLTQPQEFIAACIQASGDDATTIPGWRDLPGDYGSGSAWHRMIALLSGNPYALVERGTDGRYHPVNGMTLGEMYDLLPAAKD